jgi:hypothetical protein
MNLYQKLIEARKEVPYLQKQNQGEQYNYVSSSQVLGNVKAKLDELGVLLIPAVKSHLVTTSSIEFLNEKNNVTKRTNTYFTELDMIMTWVNAEKPDEKIECSWYGQGVDIAGEKGVGKALTYAEKYFMLKFFNIPTDKDDPDSFQKRMDGEEPHNKPQNPPQQTKPSSNGNNPLEPQQGGKNDSTDIEKRATAIYYAMTGNKEGQHGWSIPEYKEWLKGFKEAKQISTDYGKKWTLQDVEFIESQIKTLPF